MATEKIVKEKFYRINSAPVVPVPDLPPYIKHDCCSGYVLKVLAYTPDATDELKNDLSGFLYYFNSMVNTVVLSLEKMVNGAWVFSSTLNGTEGYGTFHQYGFFVNAAGEKFIGYQLVWNYVLADTGEGMYRVKCEATNSVTGVVTTYEGFPYCLKSYTPELANGTVRVEYRIQGVIGDNENDKHRRDLGTISSINLPGWYNSYRLPGYFGYGKFGYTKEYVRYDDGKDVPVKSEQVPEYLLEIKAIPYFVHEVFRTDIMQANECYITSYSSRNPGTYFKKDVQFNSSYDPKHRPEIWKLAPVTLTCNQRYNNLQKKMY